MSMLSAVVRALVAAPALLGLASCSPTPIIPATVLVSDLSFQRMDGGRTRLAVTLDSSSKQGSIVVASVGRGDSSSFAPPVIQASEVPVRILDGPHAYTRWPKSGTALYAAEIPAAGSVIDIYVDLPAGDEVTLAAVRVSGTRIQSQSWLEVLAGNALTSGPVTTTGPATLVAFWWGDGTVRHEKTARPNNGFRVVQSVLESGALVQCAVAVKQVDKAGSYDVTWKSTPKQGAQLYLVAIE